MIRSLLLLGAAISLLVGILLVEHHHVAAGLVAFGWCDTFILGRAGMSLARRLRARLA